MKKMIFALLLCALLCGCGAAETQATAEPTPQEESAPQEESTPAAEGGLSFTTSDMDGNEWDESAFAGQKLTMLNFWEPWCGPCVAEMPDLEKLYQTYKEQGLQILGVYSTEEDADDIRDYTKVSYPLLRYVSAFDRFQSGYVPTTVFVDENGEVVGESAVGAKSYEDWAALVEEYLE